MKVNIIIEKDQYGYYAFCPELKGCHTQGDSLEEVLENIKEAIELYLEPKSYKRRVCRRPACCRQVQGSKGADVL